MDLHRTAFKMENAPYVPSPLTSPALMVLASTAEAGRDASVPCQPPRPFGVPVTLEKDMHLPFPTGSYTFTSLYHRQAGFAPREFPSSLLHLHPQFAPANLDCPPLSMLPHGGVGAFRPFPSSVEERDSAGYHSAFLPTKRLKGCVEPEAAARLHFADVEGKEFDFGGMAHANSGSPSALKTTEDPGKRQFGVSGLLADGEASCSPEEYKERCKLKGVCDTQTPVCPVCQDLLRPSELQEHMEHEMERLTQLHLSQSPSQTQCAPAGLPKSVFSLHIKREGGSCGSSPRPAEEAVHSDRYQMFLRVRANRQTRLGARIGKMKRRKTEEEQRDSVCAVENGSLGAGADEYGWSEHRRMHMVSILRGFRGLVSSTSKEPHDSDVDLDVDGDDTLSYGKAQYTETDVIPHCRDVEDGETVFNGHAAIRVSPECTKWSTPDTPSTSSEGHSKQDSSLSPTCKSCEIEMMCDDSLNTLEALKTRIRDLEKQLTRGDRIKCLICMDSYAVPLTSIQCWHVHCEECWLRTLGAKKLCPQCNTITSPGDLRRVYL
ncbi:E3 ubiquitin-protein ligase RNF220 isoform X2 [Electrophorus electricus]|uniref:E3 ubiquitin-protein ligase RNF220 isoform X2 n=1 Tax=Electrophorus electricus TaxID=8005 RepID=UPI0015D0001A|nr:E3 ubiquitin-protein ligase RNF220 isoform X2 [Electrophorus electricus]